MKLLFCGAHALTSTFPQAIPLKLSYLINAALLLLLYKKARQAGFGWFESAFFTYCLVTLFLYSISHLSLALFK